MASQHATVHIGRNGGQLPEVPIHTEQEHLPLPDEGEKERYVSDGPQLASPASGIRRVPTTQPGLDASSGSTLWKKKRLWVPLANAVLLTAITGGIMGGWFTHRDRAGREATNQPPNSTARPVPRPKSTAETVPQPSTNPLNSRLASVSCMDNEGMTYRRPYYQDFAGTIKESAWNSSSNGWYSSNNAPGQAIYNSPLAAAVAGNQTWDFVSVYITDHDRSPRPTGSTTAAN
ncbi:MAG: hypothetical protein Q9169_006378 [Polycauliona sp. 2 TL-2023]